MTDEASKAAKLLGRLGGAKGGKATGKAKVRGDSAYYKGLSGKRTLRSIEFAGFQAGQAIIDLRCSPGTAYLWARKAAHAALILRPELSR